MHLPDLLPTELLYAGKAADDEALYALLLKNTSDLIFFFESAADDETWSERHSVLMEKLLQWITDQVKRDKLDSDFMQRALQATRKHYHVFKGVLPQDIVFAFADRELPFNSFIFAASSEMFRAYLQKESAEKEVNTLSFHEINAADFAPYLSFMNTGTSPGLQILSVQELYDLVRQSYAWGLDPLAASAEYALKKYIAMDNVMEMLRKAITERWPHLAQKCAEYINDHSEGFKIHAPDPDHLLFEFTSFSDEAMAAFNQLKPKLTGIVCSGEMTEHPRFGPTLKASPHLLQLDISGSSIFSEQLRDIPTSVNTLDLSECSWLDRDSLKQLVKICPQITTLTLSNNTQLNYSSWGEVAKFTALRSLSLSGCHQLEDSDLKILLSGLRDLKEVTIAKCSKIGENGFIELAKRLPKLAYLDVSRTDISDTALVEIGSRCALLAEINLSSCSRLTEKGILALIKIARSLRKIDLSRCNLPQSAMQEIGKTKPLRVVL